MHVILKARVPDGIMLVCECGKLLGILKRPYDEDALELLMQGHRLHVFNELDIGYVWRCGSTTQIRDQIDPLKNATS